MFKGSKSRCATLLFSVLMVTASVGHSATCAGDCDGDGRVELADIVDGFVRTVLDGDRAPQCSAETRAGGTVIDDVVAAVNAAKAGCDNPCAPIAVPTGDSIINLKGRCDQPLPNTTGATKGLGGCHAGTRMRAWRCNDRQLCATGVLGRTYLGCTEVLSDGTFSLATPRSAVIKNGNLNPELLLEAQVQERRVVPALETRFRDLATIALGSGAAPAGARGSRASEDVSALIVDPNSEGAVRARSTLGVAAVDDVSELARRTRDDVRSDYTGTLFDAAKLATEAANIGFDISTDSLCTDQQIEEDNFFQDAFVSDSNIVYQVIRSRCASDLQLTTLVGAFDKITVARDSFITLGRLNSRLNVGVTCEDKLEPAENVRKSGLLRLATLDANSGGGISFDHSGDGRLCTSAGDCFSIKRRRRNCDGHTWSTARRRGSRHGSRRLRLPQLQHLRLWVADG